MGGVQSLSPQHAADPLAARRRLLPTGPVSVGVFDERDYRPRHGGLCEHVAQKFAEWSVDIGGLVQTPMSWSLATIKELPARTQITRHDCVEGWSAIGKWIGVPLGDRMHQAADAEYQVRRLPLRRRG